MIKEYGIFRSQAFIVILFALLCVALLMSLVPYQTIVVPEWAITVVSETNVPLENIEVRQYWQHCSLEDEGHEEYRTTDQSGQIVFPKRTIRANSLKRMIGPIRQFMTSLFEAGYGPQSWVIAVKDGKKGSLRYSKGKSLGKIMIIKDKIRISK